MSDHMTASDPSTWDPELDAVIAAPANHRVVFENDRLRVLEVLLEPGQEEPLHHHRWPSVFVLDQITGPIRHFTPEGEMLPPDRDVMAARSAWDGEGCLVVRMSPQPPGRVLNASDTALHGIRIEMKA
jgi:hypothetical protein